MKTQPPPLIHASFGTPCDRITLVLNEMLNLFAFDTFSTLLMPAIAVWNTYGRRHNMAKSIRRIEEAARAANLEIQVEQMPGSTHTATQAAKACGCHVGQIIK